jgi:tetratricopeptide (TPR) repeat protein
LLDDYRDTFISTHLLFPHVGIACIERLQKLSNSGLFLLTADKGEHHLSNLDAFPAPSLSSHGSFSFNVNYHVLKQYCIEKGGIQHFPNQQQSSLDLGCLLFLEDAQSYQETHHAYERFVQNFGPDDYFSMKKFAEVHFDEMSFRDILAILRLSGYDGKIFWQMLPRLYKLVPVLQENERWNIFLTVPRVWDTYFPLGEPADLASELGKLLMDLDYFEEALVYFEKSILIYGKTSEVQYEVALCYCLSGSFENAAPIIAELMTIDPENEALQMLLTDFDPSLAENTEG